jgi:hypothetical protein
MYKINTLLVFLCSITLAFSQDNKIYWSSAPTVTSSNEKIAKGSINGIGYTYTSSKPIEFSDEIFSYSTFPTSKKIPNQKCIKNTQVSKNTIIFDKPVKDPYLLFASIGRPRTTVSINFDQEFIIEFQKGITYPIIGNVIKGEEGYLMVRIPGIHSKISFDYTVAENYANFMFGASVCPLNN